MAAGVDPLVENELGHDLFHAMKEQYQQLGIELREVQVFIIYYMYYVLYTM
jgi:hypothetical protein